MADALSVSLVSSALGRVRGVRTVSSGTVRREVPQSEVVDTYKRYQREAAADPSNTPGVVAGLWKSEGFSGSFGKRPLPENTLNDPRIPRESLGIGHVGYGAATSEFAAFDTGKIIEIIETHANPNYRQFSYEGIGSMLRIYEPGFFKLMSGVLGLIPLRARPGPDSSGFFARFLSAFPPDTQSLIVHAYGRMLAFSNISVYKAIRQSQQLPAERVEPCVRGIGFAFAIMNHVEMARLLENSAIPFPDRIRAEFQTGMVYAMVFCDWFVPGFLAAWRPQGKLEERLVAQARADAALNVRRGYPLPFRLENPIR